MWHVDTLSTIYRHIFHSKLPTKSSFVEEKWSKVGPILSKKFQITYKIIVCGGEKTVKIGTMLSRKSSKGPSWLAMCNVYFRNELPTGLPAHLMPFSIWVTSCRYELAVIFMCRLCIDIGMSNRHVVSFCEYSDNRYFRQSITALSHCLVAKVIRHNPPLPCPPIHALPVLNHDRINHNTNPMEHWCIATVAWTSGNCMTSLLCWQISNKSKKEDH